jgi:hypothetical protein
MADSCVTCWFGRDLANNRGAPAGAAAPGSLRCNKDNPLSNVTIAIATPSAVPDAYWCGWFSPTDPEVYGKTGPAGPTGPPAALIVSTVAGLPSASGNKGATALATDATFSNQAGVGQIVVGGGAYNTLVFSDGTNWVIA